ncbi:hypothetical protein ACGFXB_12230 [Streptomyces canus]|uniref:hypothetical protein n=1 Tax=Streptomyces canus TaxID=58343 RepID=UPI003713D28F
MPRRSPRGVGLRPLRAGVFAAVCVVTTAFGHALMSGDPLPWWALGAAFAGAAGVAWWLTRRERGAMTVIGATALAQGLLHLWFDLAHTLARGPAGGAGAEAAPGMHHAMSLSPPGTALHMAHSGAAGMEMDAVTPAASVLAQQGSAGMFLAHLLAAVVCGLWLWRGEAAAHRLGRAVAVMLLAPLRRLRRVLAGTVPGRRVRVVRRAGAAERAAPTAAVVLRHAVVRRGPPGAGPAVLQLLTTGPLSPP